jgi:hypothetical protein
MTINSAANNKSVCYHEFRAQMRDADVLLFKGSGWVSNIIKWKTKSAYSHAGLVAWWGDRLMVLEAVGNGVRATPISYNLQKYSGGIDYYRCTIELSDPLRQSMLSFAQQQLGKEYSFRRLVGFFFKLILNKPLEQCESAKVPSTFFCSEYVAEVYEHAGCDLVLERSSQYTSPDKLACTEKLEFVGTLKSAKVEM